MAVYYISDSLGNDGNDGLSEATAWQTLTQASSITYSAGDRILLKCGDTWSGQEFLGRGDGTDANYIEISSYGDGDKPILDAPAYDPDPDFSPNIEPDPRTSIQVAIKIKEYQGWKISNVRIQNSEYGIIVSNFSRARAAGTVIDNCDFENILGGRLFAPTDAPQPLLDMSVPVYIIGLDNVFVSNLTVLNTDNGIALRGLHACYVENISVHTASVKGGDAIAVVGGYLKNSVFQHIGYPNGSWEGTAGYVFAESNNWMFSDNVIADIYDGTGPDGVGIDYEAMNKNVTVERCLIHDCHSAAFLVFDEGGGQDNQVVNIINNVIYNTGMGDPATIPAYIRQYGNLNCQGTLAGNRIQRYADTQPLFTQDGVPTNDYPATYYLKDDTIYKAGDEMPTDILNPTETTDWYASNGFSSLNGANNWYYLEIDDTHVYDMTYEESDDRYVGPETMIGETWQYPGVTHYSVRKWIVPRGGMVGIAGTAAMSAAGGDGVTVSVLHNGVSIFYAVVPGDDTTGIPVNVAAFKANAGDYLYFMVTNNGTQNFDTVLWNPQITWSYASSWNALEDFSNVQCRNDWTYTSLMNLDVFDHMYYDSADTRWYGTQVNCLIGSNWQLPDAVQGSSRNWIAPRAGTVNITAMAGLLAAGGNGVKITLLRNNFIRLITLDIDGDDTTLHPTDVAGLAVLEGDIIRFLVESNGDAAADSFAWDPSIVML